MQPIIEVRNLGKKYEITHGRGGYIALRDVLTNVLRQPFAFLRSKAKRAIGLEKTEEFWALKDVSFTIERGEIVGVIGKNGAGKSTLLKVLTSITPPTEGEAILRGKVSSLLEVGTGFHPELTGRENIFLNAAILGMSRKEMSRKFNEIVEFAGIERFLDTPVKHYSSGMYVRLAFSVAAHLEPDVLLVDEVLAVGDVEFQEKCIGKMEEVTRATGRTILFVSHNMAAIQSLCKRSILLEKGKIAKIGPTAEVIDYYLDRMQDLEAVSSYPADESKEASITKISLSNEHGRPAAQIPISEDFEIKVEYQFPHPQGRALLSVLFYSAGELLLLSSESDRAGELTNYEAGRYETTIRVPAYLFNVGHYYMDIALHRPNVEYLDKKDGIGFEIMDIGNIKSMIFRDSTPGKMATVLPYQSRKL